MSHTQRLLKSAGILSSVIQAGKKGHQDVKQVGKNDPPVDGKAMVPAGLVAGGAMGEHLLEKQPPPAPEPGWIDQAKGFGEGFAKNPMEWDAAHMGVGAAGALGTVALLHHLISRPAKTEAVDEE